MKREVVTFRLIYTFFIFNLYDTYGLYLLKSELIFANALFDLDMREIIVSVR